MKIFGRQRARNLFNITMFFGSRRISHFSGDQIKAWCLSFNIGQEYPSTDFNVQEGNLPSVKK